MAPYLASILEELMGPVNTGFQAVRLLLEDELTRVCKDFPQDGVTEELQKVRERTFTSTFQCKINIYLLIFLPRLRCATLQVNILP